MDIIKVIAVGIITAICVVILKQVKPEMVLVTIIAGTIVILFLIMEAVGNIFGEYKYLLDKTGLNSGIFTSVLKVIGVGYLVEFAGDICNDAGVGSISQKILLAGKVLIIIMCLPVIRNLINIILEFIQ